MFNAICKRSFVLSAVLGFVLGLALWCLQDLPFVSIADIRSSAFTAHLIKATYFTRAGVVIKSCIIVTPVTQTISDSDLYYKIQSNLLEYDCFLENTDVRCSWKSPSELLVKYYLGQNAVFLVRQRPWLGRNVRISFVPEPSMER
jgi:hypothetical protein